MAPGVVWYPSHGPKPDIYNCVSSMSSLVLIPGLLCDRRLWSDQTANLASLADITIVDITRHSTISEMASTILDESAEHFSLAGFSLGSQVALEIMHAHPERVERLALLSATHGGLLPSAEAAIRRAITTIEQEGLDRYLEEAYPTYVAAPRIEDKVLKRIFVDMAHAVGTEAGLRQMCALLAIKTLFENLNQIHCPTVIVGGREDRRTTPEAHQLLKQEIPGSELVLVDDAAHFTPIEQPGVVTEVLRRWMTR